MTPKFHQAFLKKRIRLTKDVYEFVFALKNPETIDFKAGQFVNIRVDDGKEKIFFRSYSIMNTPDENSIIKSCIKIIPGGRCSQWLENIPMDTSVTLMGPIGMFTFRETSQKNSLFVATGTGITPLYSMIVNEIQKGNKKPMHLVWGFRHEEDIFYQNFFEILSKKYPNFHSTITLSQSKENWMGEKGRVTDYLEKNFPDSQNTEVYICGLGKMVLDVKNLCIQKGMPSEAVHFEKYD